MRVHQLRPELVTVEADAPRTALRDLACRLVEYGFKGDDGRGNVAAVVEQLDGIPRRDGVLRLEDENLGGEG